MGDRTVKPAARCRSTTRIDFIKTVDCRCSARHVNARQFASLEDAAEKLEAWTCLPLVESVRFHVAGHSFGRDRTLEIERWMPFVGIVGTAGASDVRRFLVGESGCTVFMLDIKDLTEISDATADRLNSRFKQTGARVSANSLHWQRNDPA